jgi:Apea-like HEPN
MPLDFHLSAQERFNELANTLRKKVKPAVVQQSINQTYVPAIEAVDTFETSDIGNIRHLGDIDSLTGEMLRLQFIVNGVEFELDKSACADLNDLTRGCWKVLRKKVSFERVLDETKKWLDPAIADKRPYCTRLVEEISPDLRSATFWMPIANLCVQSPLKFADVVFREISINNFEEWKMKAQAINPIDTINAVAYLQHQQKKFLGLAAAIVEVETEPSYGIKLATETATRAVTLLRTFCPENFHIRACSFTLPFGRTFFPSDIVWRQAVDCEIPEMNEISDMPAPIRWEIADTTLSTLHESGLTELSRIAGYPDPTKYQQKLIDALLVFNRANITTHIGDKLFYIIVSLEMLLLKNDTENLQMGDRLAFAIGRHVNERLQIVTLIRDIYQLRSRYVHHGILPESNEPKLNEFLRLAWTFLTWLILSESKFSTHESMIEDLEKRKYS